MDILVPTDFSKSAENALNCALDLYRDTPCTFYLLNAFQVCDLITGLVQEEPGEKEFEAARSASERGLKQLLEKVKLKADKKHHCFKAISMHGMVPLVIKEVSRKKSIDLIVMGTKEDIYPLYEPSQKIPLNRRENKKELACAGL